MSAALLTLLVVGFQKAPAKAISVSDLVKDAKKYDQKSVTITGKLEKYEEKVAKKSKKPYTVMIVTDGKAKVNVYFQNKPADKLKKGDKVKVTGIYRKEKKVGTITFKNEIDASNDKVKTNGVKPVK